MSHAEQGTIGVILPQTRHKAVLYYYTYSCIV